ncbi:DUF523 domain-containing protein [Endozoicomonas sp. OPT23]|uniref:DUF523 domain-containing protein n=1 Tax=Endozoicomonas sp. OPT23 TaxID=2072845 RepID=UPI00129B4648|nr:DUF523 domain-containing protein [Endozoicomonas sp. OPT23]MRI35114.1 DUF523 domain-containing protein [Endozoicomonas sp. OPT23]
MNKILISACLLGDPVRYNGKSKSLENEYLRRWRAEDRLVPICPEIEGGLPVPREPAEILDGLAGDVIDSTAEVETINGNRVTESFLNGAKAALKMCQKLDIKVAILTDKSPSCGSHLIYDGTFSGQTIHGMGVTAAFLERHSIKVFSEQELQHVNEYLFVLDKEKILSAVGS